MTVHTLLAMALHSLLSTPYKNIATEDQFQTWVAKQHAQNSANYVQVV